MKSISTLAILTLFCFLHPTAAIGKNPANQPTAPHHSYKQEAGNCTIPADQYSLDVNSVRTRLLDAGDMWWDLTNGKYEVPKGSVTSTTPFPQAIFAGSIWISALDQGNNLKLAALEYRQGTSDYYTGPLDNTGAVTQATCSMWDQHFPVWSTQIRQLINTYSAQGSTGTIATSLIPDSIKYWPGMGNPFLSALGYDVSGVLAPFYDANGDGIYDPTTGDYPTIRQSGTASTAMCGQAARSACSAYADEMIFWVMNDVGNTHTVSGGAPIGVQINALAYAFQGKDAVDYATFYNYNIINKSGTILKQAYISQWTDADLGCANNDRVGCDTSRNMAITYNGFVQGATQVNGVTADEGSVCPTSEIGYGSALPMLGIQILEGPADTAIDPITQLPKKLGMTSFCYFTNGAALSQADPTNASMYRDYMTGHWGDGSVQTYGGTGFGGSIVFPYAFPGDPAIASQWSECNQQTGAAIAAGDRRMVQSAGPFTFMPCASETFSIGVLFIQPPGGIQSNCPSFSMLDSVADQTKAFLASCISGVATGITKVASGELKVYPNPVSSTLFIIGSDAPIDLVVVYDISGRQVLHTTGKTNSLDMSGLQDGVYFVKTNTSDKLVKIVKE